MFRSPLNGNNCTNHGQLYNTNRQSVQQHVEVVGRGITKMRMDNYRLDVVAVLVEAYRMYVVFWTLYSKSDNTAMWCWRRVRDHGDVNTE